MSSSTPASSSQFSSLLGSTIEAIIHELLYSRSIYPPDSFILHRHLGVRCHASRVPQVGDYIANFLRVAIPSIISGVGNTISLIILEEEVVNRGGGNEDRRDVGERTGGTQTVERFVWEFHMDNVIGSAEDAKLEEAKKNANLDVVDIENVQDVLQSCANKCDTDLVVEARSQLERSMRECLLRVIALRKRRKRKDEKPENMSFKLCMEVAEDKKKQRDNNTGGDGEEEANTTRDGNSCPELMNAMQRGEWHVPEQSSCLFSKKNTNGNGSQTSSKGLMRPIKDVRLPSCGLHMALGMEVDPSD